MSDNGWTVSKEFGHLSHGYCVTSYASQGKTVDRVFIGESAESLGAASREQFYVSASRGREQVTVYTDDKHRLIEAINRTDDRLTATELVQTLRPPKDRPGAHVSFQQHRARMRRQLLLHSVSLPMNSVTEHQQPERDYDR